MYFLIEKAFQTNLHETELPPLLDNVINLTFRPRTTKVKNKYINEKIIKNRLKEMSGKRITTYQFVTFNSSEFGLRSEAQPASPPLEYLKENK